ncbi:MAG TPA: type 1 glutamine amidotransferase [Acidimicrobiales bacterium]|jgi:GMP synthase-like glutamine amidotransferase
MTKCLVIQHVAAESSWAIGDALDRAGVAADIRRADAADPIPGNATGHGALVVMGGPMSALYDEGFPSRRAEVALLADFLALGKPTLGVCLGAQLLAIAAGAAVRPGESGPEIGWGPVELSPHATTDTLLTGLPRHIDVLHWHGDTFELPPGSVRLAASPQYRNQAFRVGEAAWGLQFHLEVTAAAVDGFVAAFGDEATHAPGGAVAIRRATPHALDALLPWRELVLDRFATLVAGVEADGSRDHFADISSP